MDGFVTAEKRFRKVFPEPTSAMHAHSGPTSLHCSSLGNTTRQLPESLTDRTRCNRIPLSFSGTGKDHLPIGHVAFEVRRFKRPHSFFIAVVLYVTPERQERRPLRQLSHREGIVQDPHLHQST